MTTLEASAYLLGLIDYEKTPAQIATSRYLNLDRMREALARADDPHCHMRYVHIAGTKGKGSTAAMVASILQTAGYRVGLFTSPHLVSFHERLRINHTPIEDHALAELVAGIVPIIEAMRHDAHSAGPPTFFEVTTLLAFRWFAQQRVDIAVLETGMGGRLDATNVIQPLVTAITTIALDHTAELGDTLAQIAAEKAGIIKTGAPVVSAPQEASVAQVIAEIAAMHGSPLYRVGEEIQLLPSAFHSAGGQRFTIIGRRGAYTDLTCPLLGAHQQINAGMAVGVVECLNEHGLLVPPEAVRGGIGHVVWPGRMQILRERPLVLLDGAHDPASITVLLAALDDYFPRRPRQYVLGFSREKDWQTMLRQLAPGATRFVLTTASNPRAVPVDLLVREADALGVPVTTAPDTGSALSTLLAASAQDALICVTGSLYLVGDALKWWQTTARA